MNAPAYQGIKDFILARIHAGEWAEGDQVPSENELAREFNVARMTVNRALRELTSEQVLTRVQGSGTFVARPKYESTLVAIRSISDEIIARGHRHQANVLHIGASIADEALAEEMQVNAGSPVFHSLGQSGGRARVCIAGLHEHHAEPVPRARRAVAAGRVPDRSIGNRRRHARTADHGRSRTLSRAASAYMVAKPGRVDCEFVASRQPLSLHRTFLI
jgi:DNA-binding transcriptional regulator YhcF (GntR family)